MLGCVNSPSPASAARGNQGFTQPSLRRLSHISTVCDTVSLLMGQDLSLLKLNYVWSSVPRAQEKGYPEANANNSPPASRVVRKQCAKIASHVMG